MAALLAVSLVGLPGVANAQDKAACFDDKAPLTVEEQRLDDTLAPGGPAVGPELVSRAGFDDDVRRFTSRLCRAPSLKQAQVLAEQGGNDLWRAAVRRAQGKEQQHDRFDDRPLYWARLQITKALRQWTHQIDGGERAALIQRFDWASRGLSDVRFPQQQARRILVTGFDPFQLNGPTVRRSNPAGAAALQLDGREIDTPQGKVVIQTAVLPVLWGGFDEGIVEQFYGNGLKQKPDAFVTVSQGRPGRFDIERWAARWRGGFPDNNDLRSVGTTPNAAGWPQPALEFIETTLPQQKMIDAKTTPYPVQFNLSFCEWPAAPGAGNPSCRADQPTPGAFAQSGGGGNYLSNESMYRANRVRVGMGATNVLGGHLHTPVLGQPADPAAITDPAFELERRNIANQVVALVSAV
ncbi:hypothetical protein Lesp02_53280 [Lentzea sp. NBRC 105346]|nr:hypothetical protein Lesp02_53280 [Lentzea sp. NBRC 105346]